MDRSATQNIPEQIIFHRDCVSYILISSFKTISREKKTDTKSILWLMSFVRDWGKTHMSGVQHTKHAYLQQISTKTSLVCLNPCLMMLIQSFSYIRSSLFYESVNSSWKILSFIMCHITFFAIFSEMAQQACCNTRLKLSKIGFGWH